MRMQAHRGTFLIIDLYIYTYSLLEDQEVHLAIFIHARDLKIYMHTVGVSYGIRL